MSKRRPDALLAKTLAGGLSKTPTRSNSIVYLSSHSLTYLDHIVTSQLLSVVEITVLREKQVTGNFLTSNRLNFQF